MILYFKCCESLFELKLKVQIESNILGSRKMISISKWASSMQPERS